MFDAALFVIVESKKQRYAGTPAHLKRQMETHRRLKNEKDGRKFVPPPDEWQILTLAPPSYRFGATFCRHKVCFRLRSMQKRSNNLRGRRKSDKRMIVCVSILLSILQSDQELSFLHGQQIRGKGASRSCLRSNWIQVICRRRQTLFSLF